MSYSHDFGLVPCRAITIYAALDDGRTAATTHANGLKKGEAHHALKRALSFYQRGEIRDRSSEGQHYRISGMNLLTAIVIFWNTLKLGEIVQKMKSQGKLISPELLAHTSLLGWEHIILTGEYRWPKA